LFKQFITYLFSIIFIGVFAQQQMQLSGGLWNFKQANTSKYYPANVPGSIHTDLLNNKLMPDPFYRTNEQKVQWVENEDWEYKLTFNCTKELLSSNHIELIFEGLDTYANVFINDTSILQSCNMFLKHTVDVKKFLKSTNNELKIIFKSAVKHGKEMASQLPYTLPGDEKVFSRKAQYQYGWDWGPRLVTCGIYKPVYINYWNDVKINDLHYQIKSITDSMAEVYLFSEIESDKLINCNVNVSLNDADINTKYKNNVFKHNYSLTLNKGTNIDTFVIKIKNPKLWNCNGVGLQNAYECYFSIDSNNYTYSNKLLNLYLRTVELIKDKDSIGESFYFKINGTPVFMKGANIIPTDNFISRTKTSDFDFLVKKAKEANINMLRVWGGGLYFSDAFYNACDRAGILVWQDFMFACAMYPGDSLFVNNIKQEAEQQVKRLRNHPCIAIWCGNNENDEGWHNWGWQKQYNYSKKDSTIIWNDYKNVFQNILPSAVKQFDSKTSYVSSSPMFGWGRKQSLLSGDSHYWGVWWGMEPFNVYEKKVGRFMSEYGFQSMPSYFTLKKYSSGDSLNLKSPYIKAHQKHPKGFETINTYMERDYKVPSIFFNYVYVSQLLQRDGMKIAIESHRRNKPYCMGTLFWQFNDCWPVTSWSAIDYENQPKALYYETKQLYRNFLISVNKSSNDSNLYNVFVVNDSLKNLNAVLKINLKNTKGEILFSKQKTISLVSNSSNIYDAFKESEINSYHKNEIYLSCDLWINDVILSHTNYFFVKPKELKLLKPTIHISHTGQKLKISSNVFVKDLYLYSDKFDLKLSNNYIDIEPNQVVEIDTELGIELYKHIKHISLYNINN
jgi:beta-mannosidase